MNNFDSLIALKHREIQKIYIENIIYVGKILLEWVSLQFAHDHAHMPNELVDTQECFLTVSLMTTVNWKLFLT